MSEVEEKVEEVKEEIAEKVEDVKEKVEDIKEEITEKVEDIKEEVSEKVEKAKEVIKAKVESMEDIKDELEKSLKKGPKNDDPAWDKFEQLLNDKTVFEVKIEEIVKSGVVAFVDEVRAFIPASKLTAGFVEKLDDFKDKKIDVIVITADRDAKKLVLSGREPALAAKRAAREAAQAAVTVDSVLDGKIESLKDYGAFVDLGEGVTGLLHVSQISYKRVNKPADVLSEGQEVKVKVIGNKDGKISLSMKALEEAPKREKKEDDERKERRPRKEGGEHGDYTEKEQATTNMGDLFSKLNIK